eukprot:TRINITY_DN6710_c3_g1_i1.p1 TRINITY_DN6710_c3_g1~~TRINITY_DN6710_c3_g1_i1.p1  ORF type:complete len:652 (+),score=43.33 TRINITY_DN6710_c3_g1_i1:84-2039(+)
MPSGHDKAVSALHRQYLGRRVHASVHDGKLKGLLSSNAEHRVIPKDIMEGVTMAMEASDDVGDRCTEFPLECEVEIDSGLDALIDSVAAGGRIHVVDAIRILQACTLIHQNSPMLSRVKNTTGPTVIIGDIHGQIGDLLVILQNWNPRTNPDIVLVFNGDLIDRGNNGCEVMLIVCALKLQYPNRIYINKGNHEDELLNLLYGFYDECDAKYGPFVYSLFVDLFSTLPLSTVVNNASFVIHGGLFGTSPPPTFLELEKMGKGIHVKPCERQKTILSHGVWSDPHPGPIEGSKNGNRKWCPSPRGEGILFSELLVLDFFKANPGVKRIIRSHQFPGRLGNSTLWNGKLITVFSASNYHNVEWLGKEHPSTVQSTIPLTLNTPIKETNKGSVVLLSPKSDVQFVSWNSPLHKMDHPLASVAHPHTKLPFQLSVINGTSSDPRNVDPNEKLVQYVRQKSLVEREPLLMYWKSVEHDPGIVSVANWLSGLRTFIPAFQVLCGIAPSLTSILKNRGFTVGSSGNEIRYTSYLQQSEFLTQTRPQPLWHREILASEVTDLPSEYYDAIHRYSHTRKSSSSHSQPVAAPILVWKVNDAAHYKNKDTGSNEIRVLSRIVSHRVGAEWKSKFMNSCNALMGLPLSEQDLNMLRNNVESKL